MTNITNLTFVRGERPLTKAYNLNPETKQIEQKSFQNQKLLSSHTEQISTIETFHEAIQKNAAQGNALLKGHFKHPLNNESRAGKTANALATNWLILDIDGIPLQTVKEFLRAIPELRNTSFVLQYSASYKIKDPEKFNAHLFFLLDEPMHPRMLKSYLQSLNLRAGIKEKLSLNEPKSAIRYLIDPTVADESRLIYIAPPLSNATAVNNIFDDPNDRIVLYKRKNDTLKIPKFDPALVDNQLSKLVDQMRSKIQLPKKTSITTQYDKWNDAYQLDKKPDTVKIYFSYVNVHAGFVYCNINDGDSKAYYFPFGKLTQQTIMRNFKHEPFFEIYKADPDFYNEWNKTLLKEMLEKHPELKKSLSDEDPNQDLVGLPSNENHFVAFDAVESAYKVVKFKEGSPRPDITTHELEKLKNYCEATGIDFPEVKPIYNFTIDMSSDNTNPIDHTNRTVNGWALPPLLDKNNQKLQPTIAKYGLDVNSPKKVREALVKECPFIWSHINSAFVSSDDDIERFLNWYTLAVIHRVKLRTAWVLQGAPGTSKSFITQNLTRHLINNDANLVPNRSLDVLKDLSNKFLSEAVFIEWEESSAKKTIQDEKMLDVIKTLVTAPMLAIRAMRTDSVQKRNNFNMVFTTNHNAPFEITDDDRRYHVAPRQSVKWQHSIDEETYHYYDMNFDSLLAEEAPRFTALLMSLKTNETKANEVVLNPAKRKLVAASKTTTQATLQALVNGDFDVILEIIEEPQHETSMVIQCEAIKRVMNEIINHVADKEADTIMFWGEIATLINIINGTKITTQHAKKAAFNIGLEETKKRRGSIANARHGLLIPLTPQALQFSRNYKND